MCGIAGYSGDFDASQLAAMSAAIRRRGPDGDGAYVDAAAGVGMAHRRLAIIDLSPTGAQPLWDAERRAAIVFNGEIYNYRELRQELIAQGVQLLGTSDTEVLLNLYLRDGVEMLHRLNGIFAFAIWDPRKAELFVARDALGVKPLYFSETRRGLVFASEIKALVPVLEDKSVDVAALHRYLSFLWCPGEGTPFRSVRKLGPGEGLIVRGGKIVERFTWYRLPQFGVPRAPLSEDEAIRGTAERLRTAVQRQMVADVPVGAFLSGGLDSSAIVTFAREVAPDLRTFTIDVAGGQETGMADDLPYAKRVAAELGVKLDIVHVDPSKMAADFPAMVEQLDEPLADPAPLNVLYISQLAREQGIKVLLSGAGGDDLFTGYRRHVALMHAGWLDYVPGALRRGAASLSTRLDQRNTTLRRVTKALSGAALDGDERIVAWFQWIREAELFKLYTPSFKQSLGGAGATEPLLAFAGGLAPSTHPLERMLALEQRFFLTDHNLLYTDKMSMAAGVEARVPFLDLELVDFASRIPPRTKQHGRIGKWVFKRAMEPYLSKDIIYRPKTGFGVPLRRWLREGLRDVVADVLSARSLSARGLFEPAAVADLLARDERGEIDASYVIFSLICIELWCRAFGA